MFLSIEQVSTTGYTITTLGCKQGGRSKNVSNNFGPCVFSPDGRGYMYLRPLLSQKKNVPPEDLHLGRGGESS